MKTTIRKPDVDKNGNIVLRNINIEDITIPADAIMSIDGSTTNTGVGILRKSDGALFYSCAFAREHDETPVQYKVRLKRAVHSILFVNRMIDTVYYEEPFIGYAGAAKNLLMLRTFIEELIVEYEPHYNYLKHTEINNMKWKRMSLAPEKCPQGTENQKAAARKKLESFMPFLKIVTQDEIDAISMGFVATVHIRAGDEETLESRKQIHKFQYNIRFIGADCDDNMITEFTDTYDGPEELLQNGILVKEINPTANFDKFIYENMGSEDKILIIKFKSSQRGNLILKHKLGPMSVTFDYIYAVVWRKTRKR